MIQLLRGSNRDRGFTLIEVLIAMLVLAIALLGLAQLQITAIQGNRFSYDMTEASSLASDTLEQLVQVYFRDPASVTCPLTETLVRSSLTFTRTCTLTGVEPGHRAATVTVTWRSQHGVDRRVMVQSLL